MEEEDIASQERQFAQRLWQRLQGNTTTTTTTLSLSNAVDGLAKLGLPVHLVRYGWIGCVFPLIQRGKGIASFLFHRIGF